MHLQSPANRLTQAPLLHNTCSPSRKVYQLKIFFDAKRINYAYTTLFFIAAFTKSDTIFSSPSLIRKKPNRCWAEVRMPDVSALRPSKGAGWRICFHTHLSYRDN